MSTNPVTQVRLLVNGQDIDTVSALDRGLQYGDGLFETLPVINGRPLHWQRHMQRLIHGCGRLGIPLPDVTALTIEAQRLCVGRNRAVLKLIVTRGSGGRGYRCPEHPAPTRIFALHSWPDYPENNWREGVRVRLCRIQLGSNPALAGLKHLNRLEHILARAEWDSDDIAEGLLFDRADHVIEGTMSNLFLVTAGQLVTPELSDCGVAGIMRDMIIESAGPCGLKWQCAPCQSCRSARCR